MPSTNGSAPSRTARTARIATPHSSRTQAQRFIGDGPGRGPGVGDERLPRRRVDGVGEPAGGAAPGREDGPPVGRGGSQAPPLVGVGQPGAQGHGEQVRVVGRHQHAGAIAGHRHAHRLVVTADVRDDDRHAVRQRLGHGHPEGLPARGRDQQVGVGEGELERIARHRPGELHPVVDAGPSRRRRQLGDEVRLEVERADAGEDPVEVRDLGQRSEQGVVALVPGDRRQAQQPPAGREGPGDGGRVDAGCGHPDQLGRQPVVADHPVPGPGTGRHDAGSGRERGAARRAVPTRRRTPPRTACGGARRRGAARRRAPGRRVRPTQQAVHDHHGTVGQTGQERPEVGRVLDPVLVHHAARRRRASRSPAGRSGCRRWGAPGRRSRPGRRTRSAHVTAEADSWPTRRGTPAG